MIDNLIECISLSKQYISKNQTVNALEDINFTSIKMKLFFWKGRSGAGKSTLLNLMCGLIKPTSG